MPEKSVPIHVVTWNVARRNADVLDALKKASDRVGKIDLVTLQEVRTDVADVFRKYLVQEMDLRYVHYDRRLDVPCQNHINVIAGRWPLRAVGLRYTRKELPWPQALTEVWLKVGTHTVVLITAHIPNGSQYGWQKIYTFEVLNRIVGKARGRPCIVTGDFNEPQDVMRDGRIATFGQKWDARQRRYVCWPTWTDPSGRTGRGLRWDGAVRWLFEDEREHGLRLAYREAGGHPAKAFSHKNHSQRRWFDHIFFSRKLFRVNECRYLHELRHPGLSDHSALRARLTLGASS